jgi:hypothetical protein
VFSEHTHTATTTASPLRALRTSDESLRIGITFRVIADQLLTTILRTGHIEVTGRLRPFASFIVPAIRREIARTMRHLKAHLDSESS